MRRENYGNTWLQAGRDVEDETERRSIREVSKKSNRMERIVFYVMQLQLDS